MMRVHVDIPTRIWARLATMADERGVKISDLLIDAVEGVLPPHRTPLEVLEHELRQARRNGWRAPGSASERRKQQEESK